MKLIGFKELVKKDLAVDYRKVYTAVAEIEINASHLEKRIEFSIEHSPLGHIDVSVSLLDHIDYPLVPILRTIKNFIHEEHKKGSLP